MEIKKYLYYAISFISGILLSSMIFLTIFLQNTYLLSQNSIEVLENKQNRGEGNNQKETKPIEMDHSMHSMEDMREMPMMNDMLQKFTDQDFLELMILHHQDALDMANNALTNSKNPFIIKLSNEIIKTQSAEISQMEQELKNVNN